MNPPASHDVNKKRRDALKAIEKAMLALHGLPVARRVQIMAKIARARVVLGEADTIVNSLDLVIQSNQETRDEEETCVNGSHRRKQLLRSSPTIQEPVDEHEQVPRGFEVATYDTATESNSTEEYNSISQPSLKNAMVDEMAWREVQPEGNSPVIPCTNAVTVATVPNVIQESMSWLDAQRAKEDNKWSAHESPTNMEQIADRIAWLENMKVEIRGAANVTDQVELAKRLMAVGTEWLKQRKPSMGE